MAQEGWKLDKDETDCQVPEAPILCINNCGFFGSPATMNLCSKCFRELHLIKNVNSFSSKSGTEMPHDTSIQIPEFVHQVQLPFSSVSPAMPIQTADGSGTSISNAEPEPQQPSRQTNRCFLCNKRVGLTGFKCRCGDTFCSQHRYSDKHNCTFDYKAAGREAIAKANPVVKAEKIEKI